MRRYPFSSTCILCIKLIFLPIICCYLLSSAVIILRSDCCQSVVRHSIIISYHYLGHFQISRGYIRPQNCPENTLQQQENRPGIGTALLIMLFALHIARMQPRCLPAHLLLLPCERICFASCLPAYAPTALILLSDRRLSRTEYLPEYAGTCAG